MPDFGHSSVREQDSLEATGVFRRLAQLIFLKKTKASNGLEIGTLGSLSKPFYWLTQNCRILQQNHNPNLKTRKNLESGGLLVFYNLVFTIGVLIGYPKVPSVVSHFILASLAFSTSSS